LMIFSMSLILVYGTPSRCCARSKLVALFPHPVQKVPKNYGSAGTAGVVTDE
jgi:hypothetical protein